MFSPCTAKRRASDKDLPVPTAVQSRTKQRTNERTEQRTAPEEDFYDYGSIHLPFCLVAVVISVAGAAAATRPPAAAVSPPT